MMQVKKTAMRYSILLLLVFLNIGCSSNVVEQVDEFEYLDEFEYMEGVVERLSDVQAVVDIQNDNVLLLKVDKGEYYTAYQTAPDDVNKDFWIDGLAVVFSANVFAIPPNVRMFGQPVDVTRIRIGR